MNDHYRTCHITLEQESIRIIREVVAETDKPSTLYSIGQDLSVKQHLALKAFYPMRLPFPLLHVDAIRKFRNSVRFQPIRQFDNKQVGYFL